LYPRWLTVRLSLCDRGCTPVGHVCRPADPTVCIFVAVYKIARGRANQAHKDTRKLRSRSGETGVSSIMSSASDGSKTGPVSLRHRMAGSCQTSDLNAPPALPFYTQLSGRPASGLQFF